MQFFGIIFQTISYWYYWIKEKLLNQVLKKVKITNLTNPNWFQIKNIDSLFINFNIPQWKIRSLCSWLLYLELIASRWILLCGLNTFRSLLRSKQAIPIKLAECGMILPTENIDMILIILMGGLVRTMPSTSLIVHIFGQTKYFILFCPKRNYAALNIYGLPCSQETGSKNQT